MAYGVRLYTFVLMEKRIKELIYRIVKIIANLGLSLYFRGIDKIGQAHIPKDDTPVIYAINHQNALIDAIIVGALSPLPTYFLTRSDVFKPPFDWFLDALKMMPIYRIRDGYGSLSKNDQVFETCKNILDGHNAILIFPEGNHGLNYYLRPLTKGISRMALQSQVEIDSDIKIVPVGLNYFDHHHSGHKLIVKYGQPLSVSDYLDDYSEHKQKGLRKITADLAPLMKETLIIPENSDDYDKQINIFQRKNEHLSFEALKNGVNDPSLLSREKTYPFLAQIGRIFGILNFPPLVLGKFIIDKKVSQTIFYASVKMALVILIFPIWFIICFLIVWLTAGILWAIGFFTLQIVTLIIRRELVRLGRA